MAQAYEAILFDFDGVLADTEPVHFACWREILTEFRIPFEWPRYEREFIGVSDREMISLLCREAGVETAAVMQHHPRKKELFRRRMEAAGAVPDDVRQLLGELHGEYRLGVVTSSGRVEIEPILSGAGLLPYLDTVVYGGDVPRLKPAPDPYLIGAKRLGTTRVLAVEDSASGVASARAAGFDVVEVRHQADMTRLVRERLAEH